MDVNSADGIGPIAGLAERHTMKIGEIFPGLHKAGAAAIDEGLLDQRSITTLRRRNCRTWSDLCELTVGDLWSVPNAGQLTVERILAAALEQSLKFPEPSFWRAPPDSETAQQGPSSDSLVSRASQARVAGFVTKLASWATDRHGCESIGDLLDALDGPLPIDLEIERSEIRRLELRDLLPPPRDPAFHASVIQDFFDAVDLRSDLLIERAIARPATKRPTLREIAEREGVTRERIRQLVHRASESVERLRGDNRFSLLRWRAADLRAELGVACPAEAKHAKRAIARAARGLDDPAGCTAVEFMLWFAGEYRLDDGWWVRSDVGSVAVVAEAVRASLASDWLLDRESLVSAASSSGLVAELSDEQLELFVGWRPVGDDWWVRWDGAIGDKAERVLSLALRAVGVEEMNGRIGDGHADSSVQNVLASDDRFVRVSMQQEYALAEWGWEEYSTAAQEIAERIERYGGEANLDDVVITLFNEFGLKESTVRAYAASPAFVVTDGVIRMRRNFEEFVVNEHIASARGVYLRPDGCVVFHLPIDGDVLRGSGRSIPNSLSVALGVRPNDARSFDAGTTHIRVSWPATAITGAAIGSTRSIAKALNATSGDVMRLVFDPDLGKVEASLVAGSSLSALTGLALTEGGEAAEIAAAIGVDPFEVRAALAERGDVDVADLIPSTGSSSKLDEALSRLDDLLS